MLRELRIENLLLIERAELRLGEGLNAITGETGAGKTVLAHSLDLLMGGKAKAQIVRPGAGEAWVEGVFDLPPGLLEEPEMAELAERLPEGAEEVVLGRRVSSGGRTSAFVAGRAATAADLKLLGGRLLAFFGQHEHRRLTIASAQLEVLDGFAGAEHLKLREEYRGAHRETVRLAAELAELREREGSRERDLDLYRYELSEIEEVAPDPAEREELGARRERLRHAEGLREAAGAPTPALAGAEEDGGGASAALAAAESLLQGAAGLDSGLDALGERVAALGVELGDVASELRDYAEGLESDPAELAATEERLEAIDRLERKHGGSVETVLAHAERCREEIARLEGAEVRGAEAEAALAAARELARRARRAPQRRPRGGRGAAGGAGRRGAGAAGDGRRHARGRARAPSRRLRSERPRDGRAAGRAQSRHRGGAAARRGLRRRALAGDAGAQRAGRGRQRRDPGLRRDRRRDRRQHGAGRGRAAAGARRRAARSSASPTCPRSPPSPTPTSGSRRASPPSQAFATVDRLSGEDVVEEISRMLGGESSDKAATQHARELLAAA